MRAPALLAAPVAALRARLEQRTPRERLLLALGAVVLGGALLHAQVWRPLAEARAAALAEIAALDAAMVRARAIGPDLADPGAGPRAPAPSVIAATAPAMGLSIQRVEPEGARTRVALDRAPFEALTLWIARLEAEHGLRAVALELDRLPEPGFVAARITLED